MDAILILFAVLAAGYLLVAPAIAIAVAFGAARRRDSLERRVAWLEGTLAQVQAFQANEWRARAAQAQLASAAWAQGGGAPAQAPLPSPLASPRVPGPQVAGPPIAEAQVAGPPIAEAHVAGPPIAEAHVAGPPIAEQPIAGPRGAGPQVAGPRVPVPELATPKVTPPRPTFEEALARWLVRAGAAGLLLGVLYFFKYAADNAWIGPAGRVAIGAVVGLGLLVAAEVIRTTTQPRFVHALTGIGIATLTVSAWASAVFYQLVDPTAAFVSTTVILLVGAALAYRYRGEAILVLTLLGGFLNPVVLSTGQDRPLALFGYLFLLTGVAQAVSLRRGFRVVPWVGVAGVVALFGGWYERFFDVSDLRHAAADLPASQLVGAYHALGARLVPLGAVLGFAAMWVGVALASRAGPGPRRAGAEGAVAPSGADVAGAVAGVRGVGGGEGARAASGAFGKAMGLAGLVLAHGGMTLLLEDEPRLLALTATLLAAGSIATLRALDAVNLLVVPMLAAFVAFLAVGTRVEDAQRTLLVGLLGVWTAAYVAGFLLAMARKPGAAGALAGPIAPAAAAGSAVAAALFACLAGVLLVAQHPALFVVLLAGSSAVVAFVAVRSELRGLLVAASVLGALVVGVASPFVLDRARLAVSGATDDPVFLGAVALWAATFLASLVDDVLRRRAKVTWGTAFTASCAVLGFVAAALASTSPELRTLRALLTGGAGGAALGVGALFLRAPAPGSRRVATLAGQTLAGLALGLFAASVAFGLSGATVTVLWAALAAVAAALGARSVQGRAAAAGPGPEADAGGLWLAIAALLFLATFTRLLGVDVAETEALTSRFFATRGREGLMAAPVLFNARAYALLGTAAALLLSLRLLGRAAPPGAKGEKASARAFAALAGILGYGLLLVVLVTEARAAFTHHPPVPPYPLDGAEWTAFEGQYHAMLDPQRGPLDMLTTLLLAVFAAGLLTLGFAVRDAFHRYLGLALFGVTVAKLSLVDVWRVERIYQIGLLTGVGALLVGGGFLYARFGQRLVALLRDGRPPEGTPPGGDAGPGGPDAVPGRGPPPAGAPPAQGEEASGPPSVAPPPAAGAAVVMFLLLTAGGGRASAEPSPPAPPPPSREPMRVAPYETVRPIMGVDVPGDYRLEVDLDLYRESLAEGLLGDLRVAGPDGLEVPSLVREVEPEEPAPSPVRATLVDPGTRSDGAVRATFSVDQAGARHCHLELRIEGDTFLRRVRVETGETDRALARVTEGAYVYRIGQGGLTVEALAVRYPLSQASLVRVTLLPEGVSSRVRVLGGTVSCPRGGVTAAKATLGVPLTLEGVARDAASKTTTVTLDSGSEGLPLQALRLEVATPEFSRQVQLTATNYREVWPPAGSGLVYRIRPREGLELSGLTLPVSLPRKRWLRLAVSDGDSAPLDVRAVTGEIPAREVIFRASVAGEHRLYVGDRKGMAARYDLGEILARAERASAPRAAALGAPAKNPRFGVEEVKVNLPFTEQHRTALGAGLAVVLVGLSAWAIRLLRKGEPPRAAGE